MVSKADGRTMNLVRLGTKSCECYMNVSLHFVYASYYFIDLFCKLLEIKDEACLISSIYDYLVGSNMNRVDGFKGRMQELVKKYVVGIQHDPFLFISHVIRKLDKKIQKNI